MPFILPAATRRVSPDFTIYQPTKGAGVDLFNIKDASGDLFWIEDRNATGWVTIKSRSNMYFSPGGSVSFEGSSGASFELIGGTGNTNSFHTWKGYLAIESVGNDINDSYDMLFRFGNYSSPTEVARLTKTGDFKLLADGAILGVPVKTTTGDPTSPSDGYLYVNTYDNKVRIYADSAWRDIITW